MGHIINPISHRLGSSKCWNSVWSTDLNFVSGFSSLMKSDWDFFLFFKRFFELKFLVQGGYIFSHVKIIRERQKIFCVVYFYDGSSLERSDNLKQILLSRSMQLFNINIVFFVSLYSFLKLYQWNVTNLRLVRNFKFNVVFNYFARKKRLLILKRYLRKKNISSAYSAVKLLFDFLLVSFCNLTDNPVIFSLFLTDYFLFFKFFKNRSLHSNFLKNFFLNVFFILILNKRYVGLLQDFFFLKLTHFFSFSRWFLFKKTSIISKIIRYATQSFAFNRFFLYYFSDSFFVFYRIKSRLLDSIKSVLFRLPFEKNLNRIKIILKKLEVSELNAGVLSKYLAIRLRQRFQLKEALMPMLRHLSNNQYVKGFRIVCAGRFTRKEIALYDLRTYSSVPFSGVSSRLDFSLSEVVLKYSICGIKVWLHRYILPERDFAVDAIGLQFVSIPPVAEEFINNLNRFEIDSVVAYRPSVLDLDFLKFFIKSKNCSLAHSRGQFARFASRLSPSFDFFFFNLKFSLRKKNQK